MAQLSWNTSCSGLSLVVDSSTNLTGLLVALLASDSAPCKINFPFFLTFVVVQDAECIDDRVSQQVFVSQAHLFSTALLESTVSNQENAPHSSCSKDRFSRFASRYTFNKNCAEDCSRDQLDPEERAVLQGMPPALIEVLSFQLEQKAISASHQFRGSNVFGSTPSGLHNREAGPAWEMQKTRALAAASLRMQQSAVDTKRGMDQLLPPGLGKEQHIKTSMDLETLFPQRSAMDTDLELEADAGNAKFNKI